MSHFHHTSNDNNKLIRDSTARKNDLTGESNLESNINGLDPPHGCKPMFTARSDGSIIKNFENCDLKQKINNHNKNWSNNKELHKIQSFSVNPIKSGSNLAIISSDFKNLSIIDGASEQQILPQSREAIEGHCTTDKHTAHIDITNSKSFAHSTSSNRHFSTEGPYSDTLLGDPSSGSTSKSITWDPWNKSERKNKKENKRRKIDKSPRSSRDNSSSKSSSLGKKSLDYTAGDETRYYTGKVTNIANSPNAYTTFDESYQYSPYQFNKKSVEFVNEVAVVYFTGDEVLTRVKEPLKKELDQQLRNKEMRRGHVPCTMIGKQQLKAENYMADWYNKK